MGRLHSRVEQSRAEQSQGALRRRQEIRRGTNSPQRPTSPWPTTRQFSVATTVLTFETKPKRQKPQYPRRQLPTLSASGTLRL